MTETAPAPAFTVEQIARTCYDAIRAIQFATGDPLPAPPWESADPEMRESTMASVSAVLEGASAEELHAGWCRRKAHDGWRRGEHKDPIAKIHPNLVPWPELPWPAQVKDLVFIAIVQAMSGEGAWFHSLLLGRAQEALAFERERADKAEAALGEACELAESWTADDGHGLPTREMVTEADCGREVLALLNPAIEQEDAPGGVR